MTTRNRKNYVIDLAQLIAWAGLMLAPSLVDLTITRDWSSSLRILTGTLRLMLPLFVVYALNYYLLIPLFLHKAGKTKWFFLSNIVLLVAWNLPRMLRTPDFPQETLDQFGEQGMWAFYVGTMLAGMFVQVILIAVAVGILNPHFLFNTLNNISSLTQIDPDKAQESIGQLSDLLRYALYDSEANQVPLSAEIDFMNNYIDLMALRCNENTTVQKELEEPKEHVQVAPLLFISLVENAFKHGVNARYPSFVRVSLHYEGGELHFRAENSLFGKQGSDHIGSGIGLDNMKRRLELLYPGRYTYSQKADSNVYSVEVTLKV